MRELHLRRNAFAASPPIVRSLRELRAARPADSGLIERGCVVLTE